MSIHLERFYTRLVFVSIFCKKWPEFFYKRSKSWISNTLELPEKILSNRFVRCWHNLNFLVQIISEPFVKSRFTSSMKELWKWLDCNHRILMQSYFMMCHKTCNNNFFSKKKMITCLKWAQPQLRYQIIWNIQMTSPNKEYLLQACLSSPFITADVFVTS